ncbi:MAG: hypothetical protein WCZ65_04895 [Lysobacteraceae bacterium]|jgi:hypothetical protein
MRVMFTGFSPPRHPLARAALGLGALVLIGVFSVIGLAVASLAVLAFTGRSLWQRLRGAPTRRPHDPRIIEGEFEIVQPGRLPRSR